MKKVFTWLLVLAAVFGLTACGGGDAAMSLDGVNTVGKAEYALKYLYVTPDVVPPNPSTVYTHYEADAGKTYLVFVVDVKNLAQKQVSADDLLTWKLTLGGQKHTAQCAVEEDGGQGLGYGNITYIDPLETARIYYMFQVPEGKTQGKLEITASAGGDSQSAKVTVAEFESRVKPFLPGHTFTDGETLSAKVEALLFSDYLYPTAPEGVYSYYEAEAGKTFLITKLLVKNLKGTDLRCDAIAGAFVTYDGKYKYSAFTAVEESDGSDISGYASAQQIAPLDSRVVYFLAEVPDEVENGPVSVTFYICGEYYTYTMN